ncbi:MAG: T9SS type A sorting domain-containing protein [Ignavibacteriaceae bacterium]|nr:T9SS type A sorting domain-containing protein [Ignavibacteriaceae bacterium]
MKYLFGLFFTLVLLNTLQAQEGTIVNWKNFLTNNDINCIVKEDNFLWIGTTGGLVKFNTIDLTQTSYTKENSGLPHHNITSITIDSAGNKWIGTWGGGVIKYDGTSWQVYNQLNSPLYNDFINSVSLDSSGYLWVAASYAPIFRYDGQNWICYYDTIGAPGDVNCIQVDKIGNIWFSTHQNGVTKFDGNNWETFTPENSNIPSYDIWTLFVDDSNYVWIGTQDSGIAKYDRQDWFKYTYEGLTTEINTISRDETWSVWVGTHNYGILKFDYLSWTDYYNAPLPSKHISSIFITNDDKKWIGTNKGFASYFNDVWMNYVFANKNLFSNDIVCLDNDSNNNLYFGTSFWEPYVFKLSQNVFSNIYSNLIHPLHLSVDYDDNIWIGATGPNGVGKYNGSGWVIYNDENSGLSNTYINCIYPDGDSLIWFGTWGGLFKFDGNSWTNYNTTNSPFVTDLVLAVTRDLNGILWIGFKDGGMFKFDGINWTWYNYNNSELPSNNVIKIIVDYSNNKWIATQPFGFNDIGGGVAKFTDNLEWTVFDTSNSKLQTNWITDIAVDLDNSIWISTEPHWAGVYGNSNYYGGGAYRLFNEQLKFFSTNNSLLSDNKVNALVVDIYGNKWFGTSNGISVYNESGIIMAVNGQQEIQDLSDYHLFQNYPNPFNPTTTIRFYLHVSNNIKLEIFNLLGEKVRTLVNDFYNVGIYEIEFNASNLPSGIYFYQLQVGNFKATKKLILLK